MFSPDITNFKIKHPHQIFSDCSLNSETLDDIANKHSFNHSVCAVFPDTLNLPSNISDCLNVDTGYYKISALPISEFVENVFIEGFIKKGELTALSIDTLLDIDNCVAVMPSGILALSLTKSAFQELGVDKGPAVDLMKREKNQLYINLKERCFKPGKKNFDRIYDRLKKTKLLTMDYILSWEPNDTEICPSSIAAYFHKKGYTVEECIPRKISRVDYNVKTPSESEDPEELFEWFGLHSLGAKGYPDPIHQEFLSSYPGMDMNTIGQVVYIQWTGLFTTRKVMKFLNELRNYLSVRDSIPFVGMHVQGFDDAPVSWGKNINHFSMFGDNNYSFIMYPNRNALIMKTFI